MEDPFCACIYKTFVDEPVTTWTTVVELIFSIAISVSGIVINYRFVKKLSEEKRNTPIGRRGNIIEPVIRWNCCFQMVFWPYDLLYFWLNQNEIISSEFIYKNSWLCDLLTLTVRFGRICIAYNSFFATLIRYLYIVHQQKANQWDFENVAKHFIFGSIFTPLVVEAIGTMTNPYTEYLEKDQLNSCVEFWKSFSTNQTVEIPTAKAYEFTTSILPKLGVDITYHIYAIITMVVYLNFVDGWLYVRIFQTMKRYTY